MKKAWKRFLCLGVAKRKKIIASSCGTTGTKKGMQKKKILLTNKTRRRNWTPRLGYQIFLSCAAINFVSFSLSVPFLMFFNFPIPKMFCFII